MPKYEASNSLTDPTWNAEVLSGDAVAEVARLKEGEGGDILIYGSAKFADALAQAGLIDEYRFITCPVVVGAGERMFTDPTPTGLRLDSCVTTSTGVVVTTYSRVAE